jgi:quinol monooxygenase YgiN
VPKIAAVVKLTAAEGKRDELVAALTELAEATQAEPGTELYAMSTDAADADAIWFFELYTDQDSLNAHSTSPAMKAVGPRLAPLMAGRPEMHLVTPVYAKGVNV